MLLFLLTLTAHAQDAAQAGYGMGEVGGIAGALTGGSALGALVLQRLFAGADKTDDKLEAIERDLANLRVDVAALTSELRTGRQLAGRTPTSEPPYRRDV